LEQLVSIIGLPQAGHVVHYNEAFFTSEVLQRLVQAHHGVLLNIKDSLTTVHLKGWISDCNSTSNESIFESTNSSPRALSLSIQEINDVFPAPFSPMTAI
jgi:hypothetical protein